MKKPVKKKKKKSPRKKIRPEVRAQTVSPVEQVPDENEKAPEKLVSRPVRPIQKKEPEKRLDERGGLFRYIRVAGQFLRESRGELKKVKWPTRKELLASTAMVIVLVLLVSFFLGIIDFALIKIIKNVVG